MTKTNLGSKNNIRNPIDVDGNIGKWFEKEISTLESPLPKIIMQIFNSVEALVHFSQTAVLFWSSCDRQPPSPGKQKFHKYDEAIKLLAKEKSINLDARPNGPAIAAFEWAGGNRPNRFGSNNKWHIHHLYSGKFPYLGKEKTLHAAHEKLHFTQSAGLISLHPLVDALADESPAFTWYLRFLAFKKFGYDPDCAFSAKVDRFGFDISRKIRPSIIFKK